MTPPGEPDVDIVGPQRAALALLTAVAEVRRQPNRELVDLVFEIANGPDAAAVTVLCAKVALDALAAAVAGVGLTVEGELQRIGLDLASADA